MMTTIVYEPKGRAKEYSELAANLYSGCSHGCIYCYAPGAVRKDRIVFHSPTVRSDVLKKLEKDVIQLERDGEKRAILLSFTTDPYQPLEENTLLTRSAIMLFHNHNLKISILTKAGEIARRDFDLLAQRPELSEFGASLVFTDERLRTEIEPFAANTKMRIENLRIAHDMGIQTFVSLEPVWDPQQSLELIDLTQGFVDLFKVGKLNHHPREREIDWQKFKKDALKKLVDYKKDYYIKRDLDKY